MYLRRLKDLRNDKDLTQAQVAQILHIAQNTYSRYETGDKNIPLEALIILAQFYETSIDYITGITDEKRSYPKSRQ